MEKFCIFAKIFYKDYKMTQEEAIIKAIEDYGGKASNKQIYERAIKNYIFRSIPVQFSGGAVST